MLITSSFNFVSMLWGKFEKKNRSWLPIILKEKFNEKNSNNLKKAYSQERHLMMDLKLQEVEISLPFLWDIRYCDYT